MLWLYLTILAYFLFALSALFDRYLLAGPLPHPRVYAFYVGITGIFAAVLIPFGFAVPPTATIIVALVTGVLGVAGLAVAYHAVSYSGVSAIVPMSGAMFPIFTFILGGIISPEGIIVTQKILISFTFFVLGTVLLSLRGGLRDFKPSWFNVRYALLIAFLFALGLVLARFVYEKEAFVNGFIWMRWGGFLASAALLLFPSTRQIVFGKNPIKRQRVYLPLLAGKSAGILAFVSQQYAVSIARYVQVAIISALQGVQYLFLLVFIAVLSFRNPLLLKEEFKGANVLWVTTGTLCILIGFGFLAF